MHKKSLLIIFLIIFIDLVGFGIVIPILPYYAESFGASATTLGWLLMSYSAMQFIFSPFWGMLSDRIGRKPVLAISILGIGLSMFILSLAQSLVWLFVGRLLAGFFGANIAAASAYIADVTSPEERAKGMGLIGAAFGLGFLFGPALGGLLSKWSYGFPPLIAGILSIINFFFLLFMLKEPTLDKETREKHRSRFTRQFLLQTLSRPQTGLAILLFFLVTLGMAQLETAFALFLLARFKLGALHAGLILGLMGLIATIIQGGAIGKLSTIVGERNLIRLGSFAMAITLAASALSRSIPLFIISVSIYSVGYAITNPSLYSLVSRNADIGRQGATMGVYQSAGSLSRIMGPIFAGLLFDHLGIEVPFLIAAFFFWIVFVLVVVRGWVWERV